MAGFGETLRQARAHKGVTLKEAEQSTRINRHHLAALEGETFDALPPLIYQRGIVRNYAVYLDLDPVRLLALFEEAHGTVVGPTIDGGVTSVPPIDMPSHWAPNFAIIAFSVVLSAIVFAWVYSAYVAPSDELKTATVVVPTMTPYTSDIDLPTEPAVTPTKEPTVKPTEKAQPTTAATQPSTANAENADGGDNQRAQTQESQAQPTDEPVAAPTEEPVVEPTDEPTSNGDNVATGNEGRQSNAAENGDSVAGITITASGQDIQLTVIVDGETVFDGTLAAGESTPEIIGTHYEVTTSSGSATVFSDACSNVFNMGYEAGDVTYQLNADANSCSPS